MIGLFLALAKTTFALFVAGTGIIKTWVVLPHKSECHHFSHLCLDDTRCQ